MKSDEIRQRFLAFFEKRRHTIIPSASLVTPDEKGVTNSTLFNTAGMQPLIPYLLGEPYKKDGRVLTRLVDSQKCLRTTDIDDIGDKTHATFFEMLGNWSLGDYFKREAIEWSYEFLTSKSEGLGLDPARLYVTVFEGDANAPRDDESANVWKSVGVPEHRIYFKDAASNWWPAVKPGKEENWTGPTGPCSEMFYDVTEDGLGDLTPEGFDKADSEQKVVEIWNDVFMEFEKVAGKIVGKLAKKNVDTGAGLERLTAVLQGKDNIYDTDLFKPLLEKLKNNDLGSYNEKSARIVLDHTRSATFLIADGVIPSNTDRGYVLRRLIRRAVDNVRELNLQYDSLTQIADDFAEIYSKVYPNLIANDINKVLSLEVNGYIDTLRKGIQKIIQTPDIKAYSYEEQATFLFDLYQSSGLPFSIAAAEILKHHGLKIPNEVKEIVGKLMNKHQSLSRSGAEQKFKGGLADANDPMVVRYHTATHLLHQALRDVLGPEVGQKGSNITAERLRFDFSFPRKMTDEEKKRVEAIVNEKMAGKLPMKNVTLPKSQAEKTGAMHFFGEKYGDDVSIYFIGDDLGSAYSKEFCGGPHVKNTSELLGPDGKWHFKIQKEEASSQGVRRIKAVLE
jgi:alanyl-tRNA synthetase